MKRRVLFGCIVFGLIIIAVIAAIEDKTTAVKPDEAEQGDRSCDWMTSGVFCNVDKNAAISDAMSRLNFFCALFHGGQIKIFSLPDCQYNLETQEWCCTICGNCCW